MSGLGAHCPRRSFLIVGRIEKAVLGLNPSAAPAAIVELPAPNGTVGAFSYLTVQRTLRTLETCCGYPVSMGDPHSIVGVGSLAVTCNAPTIQAHQPVATPDVGGGRSRRISLAKGDAL